MTAEAKVTRRQLLRKSAGIIVGASALGAAGWGRFVEPEWVEIEEVEVPMPHLPSGFEGYRIAQVSDIHIEGGSMSEDWPVIAEMVTRQKPDLICLTGDYISDEGDWQAEVLTPGFQKLAARDGVLAIMGNHDNWNHYTQSRTALRKAGILEMNNLTTTIERGGDKLTIAGVDDLWRGDGDIAEVARQIRGKFAAVLLAHEPDFADEARSVGKFGLQLSGHSHGGQIALPVFGPIHMPPYGRKYPRGLYDLDGMHLYTNRGLGTVGPPIRLCARPEITVITLRAI